MEQYRLFRTMPSELIDPIFNVAGVSKTTAFVACVDLTFLKQPVLTRSY